MVSLAAMLVTAALAPTGTWTGATPEAPGVSMTIKGGTVVAASAWSSQFECELGGFIGPVQVTVKPKVRISPKGVFSINSGRKSRRLKAKMRYRNGRITGRIRIVGDVGGPCSSPTIPVTLSKR